MYNYDLIGFVESHLDSTIDKDKVALNGCTLINEKHPQSSKGMVLGCLSKITFHKNRSDLVTLPECIVYEIQLNWKKYLFAAIYRRLTTSVLVSASFIELDATTALCHQLGK